MSYMPLAAIGLIGDDRRFARYRAIGAASGAHSSPHYLNYLPLALRRTSSRSVGRRGRLTQIESMAFLRSVLRLLFLAKEQHLLLMRSLLKMQKQKETKLNK